MVQFADWRAFRVYLTSRRDVAVKIRNHCSVGLANSQKAFQKYLDSGGSSSYCINLESWQDLLLNQQVEHDDLQKLLAWANIEMTKLIAEAASSMESEPELLLELESKSLDDMNVLLSRLESIGGMMDKASLPSKTGPIIHRLLHLDEQILKVAAELTEWRRMEMERRNEEENAASKGKTIPKGPHQPRQWQAMVKRRHQQYEDQLSLKACFDRWVIYWQRIADSDDERATWNITYDGIKDGNKYAKVASDELPAYECRWKQMYALYTNQFPESEKRVAGDIDSDERCKRRRDGEFDYLTSMLKDQAKLGLQPRAEQCEDGDRDSYERNNRRQLEKDGVEMLSTATGQDDQSMQAQVEPREVSDAGPEKRNRKRHRHGEIDVHVSSAPAGPAIQAISRRAAQRAVQLLKHKRGKRTVAGEAVNLNTTLRSGRVLHKRYSLRSSKQLVRYFVPDNRSCRSHELDVLTSGWEPMIFNTLVRIDIW